MKFYTKAIEVKNLNYSNILTNINFSINEGDYVALIGPNGGGKSTLVKLILNLYAKDSGDIKIFGVSTSSYLKHNYIGYLPQNSSNVDTNFPITVKEFLRLCTTKANKNYLTEITNKLQLDTYLDKRISELSGGWRQKVMIARALANRPKLLILDEPNTGVDVSSQKLFYDFLKHINRQDKITIILITHDLGDIKNDISSSICVNKTLVQIGEQYVCHHWH